MLTSQCWLALHGHRAKFVRTKSCQVKLAWPQVHTREKNIHVKRQRASGRKRSGPKPSNDPNPVLHPSSSDSWSACGILFLSLTRTGENESKSERDDSSIPKRIPGFYSIVHHPDADAPPIFFRTSNVHRNKCNIASS